MNDLKQVLLDLNPSYLAVCIDCISNIFFCNTLDTLLYALLIIAYINDHFLSGPPNLYLCPNNYENIHLALKLY